MSLSKAAKYLESHGRNGDSVLVHMTPGEVRSLQTIAKAHGGSLTINPATGLAEASFLKNLLPAIAGAALTYFSGGTLGPWSSAMLVGGAEGLRTGDIGKGLMAGVGAFGGSGLGGAALGSAAAPVSGAGSVGINPGTSAGVGSMSAPNAAGYLGGPTSSVGLNPVATGGASGLSAPASSLYTPNLAASGGVENFLGSQGKNIMMAGAPVVSEAMAPKPIPVKGEEPSSGRYLASDFEGYTPRRPDPYYRPLGLGYASGGEVDPLEQMAPGGLAAIQGVRDGYGAPQTMAGNIPQFASGGQLGGYSDGGRMLKGPGDGMSDSIPATIGAKQPARLADGEFVVPADVVSHLGNGSTDAGAKQLYAMMNKVRKARTGTKKQGKQIKPQKFMPA